MGKFVTLGDIRQDLDQGGMAYDMPIDLDHLAIHGSFYFPTAPDKTREAASESLAAIAALDNRVTLAWARENGLDLLFLPSHCSGSDYSGGVVDRANLRYLLAETPEENDAGESIRLRLYGGYGSYGVAYNLMTCPAEVLGLLAEYEAAVRQYPIADDQAYEAETEELRTEAWESWAAQDFANYLSEAVREEDEAAVLDADIWRLYSVLWDMIDMTNAEEIFETGASWYTSPDMETIIENYGDPYTCTPLLELLAEASTTFRGHAPLDWERLSDHPHITRGTCPECGMTVDTNTRPMPNQIHIAGEAVALGCTPDQARMEL